MDGFDQNLMLLLAVAAIAFYIGRMSAGSAADRERYKAYDRQLAQENMVRLPADTRHEVERFVAQGQIIEAVKVVRSHLSLGLKEAKMVVDVIKASRP